MPEYGRIVQQMVDYALTIENREKRQQCAETIVKIMGNFNPQLQGTPDFTHKLWDHLAAMSGYKLDIDYPYEIKSLEDKNKKPEKLAYPMTRIRYRHYGHLLESLIEQISEMEPGPTRDQLSVLVAGQMRQSLQAWNKDSLSAEKIVSDLANYTDGKIQLDPASCLQSKSSTATRSTGKKKRK